MALRKFNEKKYHIAKLAKSDEVGSKPLPKPEPVVPVAKAKTKAPKLRAKSTK